MKLWMNYLILYTEPPAPNLSPVYVIISSPVQKTDFLGHFSAFSCEYLQAEPVGDVSPSRSLGELMEKLSQLALIANS